MRKQTLILLLAASLSIPACSGGGGGGGKEATPKVHPGVAAAGAWLALVDGGDYMKSWEQAAVYFKNNVTPAQWVNAMNGVRAPLGRTVSRELSGSTSQKSLPGAPDGDYLVIQYSTSFDRKASSTETVTASKEQDGAWKIAGYFIK